MTSCKKKTLSTSNEALFIETCAEYDLAARKKLKLYKLLTDYKPRI